MQENIRWFLQKDIRSVLETQNLCPDSIKWTKKDFIEAGKSKKKSFLEAKNFPIIYVYELDKKVVGYIVYRVDLLESAKMASNSFYPKKVLEYCSKNGSLFCGEIINFCVHPDYRKKGIGSSLFDFVIEKFSGVIDLSEKSEFRPFMLFTIVSEKNLGTLNFLKRMNFYANKVYKDHFEKDHDGYGFYFQK